VNCPPLVTLALLATWLWPARADLEADLAAYSRGDYATAATEYRLAARTDGTVGRGSKDTNPPETRSKPSG
jgi:hypothetical protein